MPWNTPILNYLPGHKVTVDDFNKNGENFAYLKERADKVDADLMPTGNPTFNSIDVTNNVTTPVVNATTVNTTNINAEGLKTSNISFGAKEYSVFTSSTTIFNANIPLDFPVDNILSVFARKRSINGVDWEALRSENNLLDSWSTNQSALGGLVQVVYNSTVPLGTEIRITVLYKVT